MKELILKNNSHAYNVARSLQLHETDEEEFEDLNEGFWEPPSTLVTPRRRPADDDYASSSRNCRPRLD